MKNLLLNPAVLLTGSLFLAIAFYTLYLLYKNSYRKKLDKKEENIEEEDAELKDIKLPSIEGIIYPSEKKTINQNLQR